ncbi:MAG: segregation/condensation protein A [Lachnospiraceae bacterium]|nr:segregation/condensation protein A [Lachnospiraceae bacterium]
MDLKVKLDAFEGPLDLLLHLIDKNKMNIFDIPIVEITAQYMEYIEEAKRQDLNIMSEFLVMAATLLSIKSKMLLPIEEQEEEETDDPRAELVEQLLQYKMYKCISYELRDKQVDACHVFYKECSLPDEVLQYEQPVDLNELMSDVTLNKLSAIFNSVMKRQENRVDPIRSKFGTIVREEVSMEEKLQYIADYARLHKRFSFRQLLEAQCSKVQIIVTFLSILELMKDGTIFISQEDTFGDIVIESKVAAA